MVVTGIREIIIPPGLVVWFSGAAWWLVISPKCSVQIEACSRRNSRIFFAELHFTSNMYIFESEYLHSITGRGRRRYLHWGGSGGGVSEKSIVIPFDMKLGESNEERNDSRRSRSGKPPCIGGCVSTAKRSPPHISSNHLIILLPVCFMPNK